MKRRIETLVALGLVAAMLSGCGNAENEVKQEEKETSKVESSESVEESQPEEESPYPEYLNLDGYRPIVKEGEEVTLEIGVCRNQMSSVEDLWFLHFIEEKLNINVDVIEITSADLGEKKNLMLTSGELPDIMFNFGFNDSDIITYGIEGELFLPISDYMDETLTPNLVQILEEYPNGKMVVTAPNGKIYCEPMILESIPGYGKDLPNYRTFIDTKYLDAAGITELPETLDGFADMLRTFKAMDPSVMGVEEIYPIVAPAYWLLPCHLMGAFGWTSNTGEFAAPVWDVTTEQIEVPCLQDKFKDYIKYMNTLYSEGLLHPDFFTMDRTAASALIAEGVAPVIIDDAHYVSAQDTWSDYVGAKPLTSEWCEQPIATGYFAEYTGRMFFAADTEYPEVCVRLLDYLMSPEGLVYSKWGPAAGSEDTLGMINGFELGHNEAGEEILVLETVQR